jgi:hypothetical protein
MVLQVDSDMPVMLTSWVRAGGPHGCHAQTVDSCKLIYVRDIRHLDLQG